jgi:hypothetical protein
MFSVYLILVVSPSPGFTQLPTEMSTRNGKIHFCGVRAASKSCYGIALLYFLLFYYIIKSRGMRWAGHVARVERRKTLIDYWWESQRERDH